MAYFRFYARNPGYEKRQEPDPMYDTKGRLWLLAVAQGYSGPDDPWHFEAAEELINRTADELATSVISLEEASVRIAYLGERLEMTPGIEQALEAGEDELELELARIARGKGFDSQWSFHDCDRAAEHESYALETMKLPEWASTGTDILGTFGDWSGFIILEPGKTQADLEEFFRQNDPRRVAGENA